MNDTECLVQQFLLLEVQEPQARPPSHQNLRSVIALFHTMFFPLTFHALPHQCLLQDTAAANGHTPVAKGGLVLLAQEGCSAMPAPACVAFFDAKH